jgi:hypothetical protein
MLIEGVQHIEGIISEEQRLVIEKIIDQKFQEQQMSNEWDNTMYRNSVGLPSIPELQPFYEYLTPLMESETGLKLKPANSYARIYFNDSSLKPHIDRDNLDLTLSIQIKNATGYEQPLYAKSYDGKSAHESVLADGDGLMVKGKDLEHWRPDIYTIEGGYLTCLFLHWEIIGGEILQHADFLDAAECQEIIAQAEAKGFEESKVIGENGDATNKHYRSSATQFWQDTHLVESRLKIVEPSLQNLKIEGWQLVRYQQGDEFKPHHDSGSGKTNRLFTVIVYLNEDFEGGETDFPLTEETIIPETGKLVIWKNVTAGGVNVKSLHAGLAIDSGVKLTH